MTTRLNNLGSILGSFLVMCLFGVALAHNFAFIGYKLHPFLLCIAAAAIGYGLIEALFAFVAAVAIYFLGLLVYHHNLLPAAEPHVYIIFSFAATAVVLGVVQNSRFHQLLQARSELEEVRNEGERLRQRLQVVQTANQKLNERILGEVTTVQSFAEIARRLSVLEEKDLYPALCDLMVDFVHAQEASVYMLQGDCLTLMAEKGWESVPQEARALVRDRDLLWTALDQRRVMTPLDLEKILRQTPLDPSRRNRRLICAPIFHPQSGEAIGVLSVDRLPFAHLHGNTLGMLGVIAKWGGESLYNATSYQELSRQLVRDDLIPGCIPLILVQDRYQQKPGQGLVVCQFQGLKRLEYADQVWFRKTLSAVLQPLATEGASIGRAGDEAYAVLLPEGSKAAETAERVVSLLRSRVQSHPQRGTLSIFVGSVSGPSPATYKSDCQRALKSALRC
ncbi:MAG: GAF domain-containing protein [Candidatus Eremiobacteraeota bacterium]|nr:GAF domain-containing protein [Candidatus Eremiobacteraeota bacterium]MCW5869080.1 GAF domain-containing protein [Candidatus Eremiobacteraeota bacterium]